MTELAYRRSSRFDTMTNWRRVLSAHRPFVVMLVIAALLRVLALVLYHPSVLQFVDGIRYLRITPPEFFGDPYSPAGYPAFLRALHFVWPNLIVTIAVQHVLGLIGGTFIYLMVRRVSGVSWLGLLPASIVLLSGDYIFLEHILMTETLFMTLVFASMYAALRGLDDPRPRLWLGVSSLLMVASALVRPITLELPLVIGLWAFVVLGRTLRERATSALAAIIPGACLLGAYLVVASSIGPYTGLNEMSGWDLYSRAAPFANCEKFTPPPGTRRLCESAPPSKRDGPFYYQWVATSPGREAFPLDPEGSRRVGEFAMTAIEAQPFEYLKAVVKDMVRYVDPSVGTERPFSGNLYSLYQFSQNTPGLQENMERLIKRKGYSGVSVYSGGIPELEAYQTIFHIDGLPVLVMAVLAIIGIALERGRRRAAIVLLAVCAFLIYLLPVLTLSYETRYGWPPLPLLAAAATLGGLGIFERWRGRFPSAASGSDGTRGSEEMPESLPVGAA